MAIPDRIAWAISHLDIAPGDRLLEVGCGRGVAMAEIAPLLTNDHITGLDRSGSAVASAGERNNAAIAAGKAAIVQCALADWAGSGQPFDKIFAINVNLFWLEAARELKLIRTLLAPEGRLLLFFEPPGADQITTIERAVCVRLKAAGYVVKQTTHGPSPHPPLVGIMAGLA